MTAMLLLLATLAASGPQAGTARFAVVVGNNLAMDPSLAPLRFADDDAVRLHRFLTTAGYQSELLTVMDPDTQQLNPQVVEQAQPPTREDLQRALDRQFARMETARAHGQEVEFLFAFAGHGQAGNGLEGGIHLLNGSMDRDALYATAIQPAPADYVHLLVDACDSFFMVSARGAAPDPYPEDQLPLDQVASLAQSLTGASALLRDPRVGFLVSTSQAAQSHEYEGFRAGVFSHVVMGALAGAADANRDGSVEYSEVLAYAAAASQAVTNPDAVLSIHGRPPARNIHRPLMSLRGSAFTHFLELGPALSGRIHVEDAQRVRYVDLNKAPGSMVLLSLMDGVEYRVVTASGVAAVQSKGVPAGRIGAGSFHPPEHASRGTDLRTDLFAVPFDVNFYRGFVASRGLVPATTGAPFMPPHAVAPSHFPGRPRWMLGLPGLGLLGAGGVLGGLGVVAAVAHELEYRALVDTLRQEGVVDPSMALALSALKAAMAIMFGVGLVCVALGGILALAELLWPVSSQEAP